jgi:hypothetical protein
MKLNNEVEREIKKGETLIISRKKVCDVYLLIMFKDKIIEELNLGITNIFVSRYNPEINKFGSLHITLNNDNQVKLTVPKEATNEVYIRNRYKEVETKLAPNSETIIELDKNNSAFDLYVGYNDIDFYVGSIEVK